MAFYLPLRSMRVEIFPYFKTSSGSFKRFDEVRRGSSVQGHNLAISLPARCFLSQKCLACLGYCRREVYWEWFCEHMVCSSGESDQGKYTFVSSFVWKSLKVLDWFGWIPSVGQSRGTCCRWEALVHFCAPEKKQNLCIQWLTWTATSLQGNGSVSGLHDGRSLHPKSHNVLHERIKIIIIWVYLPFRRCQWWITKTLVQFPLLPQLSHLLLCSLAGRAGGSPVKRGKAVTGS